MENGPFIGDFPIKTSIHRGYSTAMFDETRGYTSIADSYKEPQGIIRNDLFNPFYLTSTQILSWQSRSSIVMYWIFS